MNLLYVAPDVPVPHTGDFVGGSTHVLKVAESLAKKGNNVLIISRRVTREQKKYQKITDNIVTRRVYRGLLFPLRGKLSSKKDEEGKFLRIFIEKSYFFVYRFILIFLVLYLLKKYKIDLILERSSSKGIGVFSGLLLGIPTRVELLDLDYSTLSLKLASKIFSYTKKIVDPNLHDKVVIVSAGVDTTMFNPADEESGDIRRKYQLKDKDVVVYVGSLSAWHGAEDLIDVAAKLREDIRFLMIGKNLESLGEKAKKKGVSSKFIFTGFIRHDEVSKYIMAGDIAVAPYNPRGFKEMEKYGFYFFPIKVLEYMACGKPIVASDLEIIRDIINENQCGLLAKPGNAEDFAEKIRMLLEDEVSRKNFDVNGRNAVIEKYTWDRIATAILGK